MTYLGFSAEASLRPRSLIPAARRSVGQHSKHDRIGSESQIVPQAYPAACQGAQGFTKTKCYGVVLTCQDCCKKWNWQQSQYVDVCGSSYVCGACFGFPW